MLAVIPWDDASGSLLDVAAAQESGYPLLSSWLAEVERLWAMHGKRKNPLIPRLDYFKQLSAQIPISPLRVVFAASGTLPAACLLKDPQGIVEHKLYWSTASEEEGQYLLAVLNSETARSMAAHAQSRGQWGARDFDKVMLGLPIPRFDRTNPLHLELAAAAAAAEVVAGKVELRTGGHFVHTRQTIRESLVEAGLDPVIEGLVRSLLGVAGARNAFSA